MSDGIPRLTPKTLPDSSLFGYSQITVAPSGCALVHIAGQSGQTADGTPAEGFDAQVQQTFENLATALSVAGSNQHSVLKITIYVVDHNEEKLALVSQARRDFFGAHLPASTLVPVPRLATDWMLFEIDAVAMAQS